MFSCKGRIADFCFHYFTGFLKGEAQKMYVRYLKVLTSNKTEKEIIKLRWSWVYDFLKISKDLSGRFSVNVCK